MKNNYIFKNLIRRVALFYISENFSNVWLNRRIFWLKIRFFISVSIFNLF